jgi:catechol 2,3-dioxygenase
MLPPVDLRPPFNITRSSHVRLAVSDLPKSRDFYASILGLVVTEEDADACYLRGLEEACHHSLVLERSGDGGTARRIGFRVFFDEDLDVAYQYFASQGLPAAWADVPHQGRTLHVTDPAGTLLELCATMETRPRLHIDFGAHKGASVKRLDHFQVLVPDPHSLCAFYSGLGFRNSEYLEHGEELLGAFMYRKGTCLDLAIVKGSGPRLHHFASLPATSPASRATGTRSSAGQDGTGPAACCSLTCATRTGTASRCSTAITRRSTPRSSPSDGTRPPSAPMLGGAFPRWRSGTSRRRSSRARL